MCRIVYCICIWYIISDYCIYMILISNWSIVLSIRSSSLEYIMEFNWYKVIIYMILYCWMVPRPVNRRWQTRASYDLERSSDAAPLRAAAAAAAIRATSRLRCRRWPSCNGQMPRRSNDLVKVHVFCAVESHVSHVLTLWITGFAIGGMVFIVCFMRMMM